MHYLDASLVVALVTDEARTPLLVDWLEAGRTARVTSDWGLLEVASALSIKQRRGDLVDLTRRRADHLLTRLIDRGLEIVRVLPVDYRKATVDAGRPDLNLRGGDALHIAVAERLGATLHSLDEGQVAAARELGLDAVVTVERENPA